MKRTFQIIFSLIVTCGTLWFVWYLLTVAWSQLGHVDPNIATAIIAALAAVTGAIYSERKSRAREIAESHREKKIELYSVYMDIIDHLMDSARKGQLKDIAKDNHVPVELEVLLKKLRRGLLVWAPPKVILAFGKLADGNSGSGFEILRKADHMFRAIREDLGNSNWGLKEGDLIKLFLKDRHEYDRLLAK